MRGHTQASACQPSPTLNAASSSLHFSVLALHETSYAVHCSLVQVVVVEVSGFNTKSNRAFGPKYAWEGFRYCMIIIIAVFMYK